MTGDLAPLVLIVDDSELNMRLARDVLNAAGLRTIEAASGAEALARAREAQPGVILLDIRLPDMDGFEVARELKRDRRTAGIPVVAVSALAAGELRQLEPAFDGYLGKPIDVRALPDDVRRFLESQPPRNGMLAP